MNLPLTESSQPATPLSVNGTDASVLMGARLDVIRRSPELHELIEPRSQGFTKYALLHQDSVAEMMARPGKQVFAFIDFGHMSVLNDVGLSNEVDAFLAGLKAIADTHFKHLDDQYKMFRIGGDEVGFHFAVSGDSAEQRLQKSFLAFKQDLKELRDRIFADSELLSGSDQFGSLRRLEAERYASVRHESRSLLPEAQREYTELGRDPDSLDRSTQNGRLEYLGWLAGKYSNTFAAGVFETASADLRELASGKKVVSDYAAVAEVEIEKLLAGFEVAVAQARTGLNGSQELLVPRVALIDLDSVFTRHVEQEDLPVAAALKINLALGMADKVTHKIQRGEIAEDLLPVPVEDGIKIRSEERDEIRFVNGAIRRFAEIKQRLAQDGVTLSPDEAKEAVAALTADPSLRQSARLDLIKHLPIKVLLEIEEPKKFAIIRFDLPGAGAVNNHGSYRKLDAMMRELTEIAQNEFPGAFVVRANGGSFFLFYPGDAQLDHVQRATGLMNKLLEREAAQLPFARLESRQKTALRDMVRHGQDSFNALNEVARASFAETPYFYRSFSPATLIPQEFLVVGALLDTLTLYPEEHFDSVLDRWNPRRR